MHVQKLEKESHTDCPKRNCAKNVHRNNYWYYKVKLEERRYKHDYYTGALNRISNFNEGEIYMSTIKKENAFKVFIVSLFFPVLYWLLLQVIPFIYGIIYGISYGISHGGGGSVDKDVLTQKLSDALTSNWLYITLAAVVVFFLIVFIVFKVRHQNFMKRIWFNPMPKQTFLFVAILAIGVCFADNLFNFILPQSWLTQYTSTASSEFEAKGLILAIIITGLIVPITEESAFRGLMVTRLYGRMSSWLVVVISGLAFALYHALGSVSQAISIVPVGVILCLVFLWTKSILATILIHMINNIINVLIMGIPALSTFNANSVSTLNLIVSIVGLAITVIMMVIIYKRRVIEKASDVNTNINW